MMRVQLRYFMATLQLLTRMPVPRVHGFTDEWMERGVKYFPLAGVLVGIFCAGILLAASHVWSGALPALLTIAGGLAITGGLHEDGFADFFDAMGGATLEARLAIMKDSRLGTYGVLALGAGIGVKVFALAALPLTIGAGALVAAHAGGRLAAVGVIAKLPYAGGLAAAKIKPLGYGITGAEIAIAAAFGLLPILLLPLAIGLPALAGAAAMAALTSLAAHRLLGGYTGDVLGAVEQVYEIGFLLCAAACA